MRKHIDCQIRNCPICFGDITHCTACGGTESSLPTEYPGKQMTTNQECMVQNDTMDFIKGKWKSV